MAAAVRGAACVVLVAVAAGCGSSHARRDAVNRYLGQVKSAQASLIGAQGQVDLTLQSFSLTKSTAAQRRGLQQARRTVATTLRRLRALHPPPDAAHLHTLLVQRLVLQRSVLDELIQTTLTAPKLAAAAAPLQQAAAKLRSDLGAIKAPAPTAVPPPTTTGAKVFATAGCAGCHTLGAAGSTGTVGPNLDTLKPDAATVAGQVRNGGGGMPSFRGSLSAAQIAAVAGFVATSAATSTVSSGGSGAVLDQYAAAFGSYGVALEPVAALLATAPARSLLTPALAAERRTLERSISLCATIKADLRRGDIAGANAAIHSLLTESSTLNGPAARKAQTAAARAYDARVHAIDALALKIDTERNRLVQLVG